MKKFLLVYKGFKSKENYNKNWDSDKLFEKNLKGEKNVLSMRKLIYKHLDLIK